MENIFSFSGVMVAEVDDIAMLRLLAREGRALALVPRVVVADELRSGALVEHCRVPGMDEKFYAITATRKCPNALVRDLLSGARRARADQTGQPI